MPDFLTPSGGVYVGGTGVSWTHHTATHYTHPICSGGVKVGGLTPRFTTLFTSGYDDSSGSLKLFLKGYLPCSGEMPLFMHGFAESSHNTKLFVDGSAGNSDVGHITLYTVHFELANSSVPLYEEGHELDLHSATLFIDGHDVAPPKGLNLFAQADPIPLSSGAITLFTTGAEVGSGVTQMIREMPLVTYSDPSGNVQERPLRLFLKGADSDNTVRNVNLWVGGENRQASNSLTLFLLNLQSGVFLSADLFVSGDGVTAGALPTSRGMNLFLRRAPAGAVTLFTAGPGEPCSGNVDMFVWGDDAASGLLNLSVPSVLGYGTVVADLYTRGW